jgi:hypothetical protein
MKPITEEMLHTLIAAESIATDAERIKAMSITLLAKECLRLRERIKMAIQVCEENGHCKSVEGWLEASLKPYEYRVGPDENK